MKIGRLRYDSGCPVRTCLGMGLSLMMATTASAQYDYSMDGHGVVITRYTGHGGAVVIPRTINHMPVVGIGAGAFARQTSITSVVIPDTVVTIGEWAFDCMDTHSRLARLKLGRNVRRIEKGAFSACDQLTEIDFPETVASVGARAFVFCGKLTEVVIPAGLTNIEDTAFNACFSLKSFKVDARNPVYCSVDGILYDKNKTRLLQFPGGRDGAYVIPDSVTNIADFALWNCPFVTSVKIPEGITSIDQEEFAACGRLATVIVPASVTNIGPNAFNSCVSMKGIYFEGNAPNYGEPWRGGIAKILGGLDTGTIYYRAGTSGWEATFGGRPTALWQPTSNHDGH